MSIPRNEYPRPDMVRDGAYSILNGQWDFEFDSGDSGAERGMYKDSAVYTKSITVPFCPESRLSGIEYKDFMTAVWYRRAFDIPEDISSGDTRVLLHFGAVDYIADVWINEQHVGYHRGGYSGFTFDISRFIHTGTNSIALRARDYQRTGAQSRGKQSGSYYSAGCDYTRTTGIWQTVWLEYVPSTYIQGLKVTPDVNNSKIDISVKTYRYVDKSFSIKATALFEGTVIAEKEITANWRDSRLTLDIPDIKLWMPLDPKLYDLTVSLIKNGTELDSVRTYFGMRSITLTDNAICINNKKVFQRLVLDQSFYPDGIYTAPTDEDIKNDIVRSMKLGFNGARLHQKIFEPRFLYWADKLGYMCWGEHANWGLDISKPESLLDFQQEWLDTVDRDFNHPCIVGWCPFNETQRNQDDRVLASIYDVTKRVDPSRPVIDTSGWCHHHTSDGTPCTDVYDVHDYEQDVEVLRKRYDPYISSDITPHISVSDVSTWTPCSPYFVSEFGGTRWAPDIPGWGYGAGPKTKEEFIERFRSIVTYFLRHPKVCAFCYTQLTDIEQEVNGLYTYDRRAKFDADVIHSIISQKAYIEEEDQ